MLARRLVKMAGEQEDGADGHRAGKPGQAGVQGFSLGALPAKAEALDSGRTATRGVAHAPPRERLRPSWKLFDQQEGQ